MSVLLPFEDPARARLKLEHWPEADRQAWEAIFEPGDILDGTVGPGHHWSEETRAIRRKGYGRWLTFLIGSGLLNQDDPPAARITKPHIAQYLAELRNQVAPWTVWGYLASLLAVANAFAPEGDWSWLTRLIGRLEAEMQPSKNKHLRLRPAHEIFDWAITFMDNLLANPPARHGLPRFRDGLMIALLITCPTLRLKNLTRIEIGKHLVRLGDAHELRFSGAEMKARKPIEIPVPSALTPYIDHYLDVVRPELLGQSQSSRLWITQYGDPMKDKTIFNGITKITERAFGRPISPHLFRDCAATSVAMDDPTHIGTAPAILGHTDPRTTETHYIQAQQIAGCRNLQASLKKLRHQFDPNRRRP